MIIEKDDKLKAIYKTNTDKKLMISLISNITLFTMLLIAFAINN